MNIVSKTDLFKAYEDDVLNLEDLRSFLQIQIDSKRAAKFDLTDLFILLDDNRYTEVVLNKAPYFVKGSTDRLNDLFEHLLDMELTTSEIRIAWLNCFAALELSKADRQNLKRNLSIRQEQFTIQERAVMLKTIISLTTSKQDVLFQSNLSFILSTTPFFVIEPILPSLPTKHIPDVFWDELSYKPLTADSLLFLIYYSNEGVVSLQSILRSFIQAGHITHNLYEDAVGRSSKMTAPLLEFFMLLAVDELQREYDSLDYWAVSIPMDYWREWYRIPCELCERDRFTFSDVLMQLAERGTAPIYYQTLALILLSHVNRMVSNQVLHSLRNNYHTLPRRIVSWYAYILREVESGTDWIFTVDDYTVACVVRHVKLAVGEWVSKRTNYTQDLDVLYERYCIGFELHCDWTHSLVAIAAEFENRMQDMSDSIEILDVFMKLRSIAKKCDMIKRSDGSNVYLLLFETAWCADSEQQDAFLERFDLLIPWMKKDEFEWIRSIQFFTPDFVFLIYSNLRWKFLCYSEIYWDEGAVARMAEDMIVKGDAYRCAFLARLCQQVGICKPWIDWKSNDLSANIIYMLLNSMYLKANPSENLSTILDMNIIFLLKRPGLQDVDPVILPQSLSFFERSSDIPDAALVLLSLIQNPKTFEAFYERDVSPQSNNNDDEVQLLLPSEKRPKFTDYASLMRHVEDLAAREMSSQTVVSSVFPFLTSANELHFVFSCVDVCTLKFYENCFQPIASEWVTVIVSLIQGLSPSLRQKMKRDRLCRLVEERVVEVFQFYLHRVLLDPSAHEDRQRIVEMIRSCGFENKSLKDLLEYVGSTV